MEIDPRYHDSRNEVCRDVFVEPHDPYAKLSGGHGRPRNIELFDDYMSCDHPTYEF